jgi:hypothetical protein
MTVPQYLRKIRMERAGEVSLTGKFIVSTARIVVGRTPRPANGGSSRRIASSQQASSPAEAGSVEAPARRWVVARKSAVC